MNESGLFTRKAFSGKRYGAQEYTVGAVTFRSAACRRGETKISEPHMLFKAHISTAKNLGCFESADLYNNTSSKDFENYTFRGSWRERFEEVLSLYSRSNIFKVFVKSVHRKDGARCEVPRCMSKIDSLYWHKQSWHSGQVCRELRSFEYVGRCIRWYHRHGLL